MPRPAPAETGPAPGDGSIDPLPHHGNQGEGGQHLQHGGPEKLGYTDTEIRQAREYLDTMEEIPEWKQLARRTANTVGGVADTVAAAPLMGAEYLVQAGKNIRRAARTGKHWKQSLPGTPARRTCMTS